MDFARLITQKVFHMKCNQIQFSYYMDGSFCSILIYIMHIVPLPLCGLYSIRAQNGYGQHRARKIVLLTLVTPRGVTDLLLRSISIMRNKYRTGANGLP